MRKYDHFGIGFEVWNRQQSWFWAVVDPQGGRGSIGVAPSEAEAVREASALIEESSGLRCGSVFAWKAALARLARYLAGCSNGAGGECVN